MGESSTEPHRIRITTNGKVDVPARAALAFLKDDPSRPVVLHTIPLDSASKSNSTLHPATLAAPRLVSVVEKVKREYMASLGPGLETRGLWQYTETGLLGAVETEPPSLERVLAGKTKPKMTHRPYLQITLSTRPLGLEKGRNVTCQTVLVGRRRGGRGKGGGNNGESEEKAEDGAGAESEAKGGDDTGEPVPRAVKRKSDAATGASSPKRIRTKA